MAVLITASSVLTCLGGGEETFAALLAEASGCAPLRHFDAQRLRVACGYQVKGESGRPLAPTRWLTACLREAVTAAGIDAQAERVVVLVGTGLRELHSVEQWALDGEPITLADLDFGAAARRVLPGVAEVYTIANACSAGGHALALGQDLLEHGAADAVVVAAADGMTESMLAMIGRMAEQPTQGMRPFDASRSGVLLGEGAAALVLRPDSAGSPALGRLLATGLSCDAHHETAPEIGGIVRAMEDARRRARVSAASVELVVAHGTATALNDPAEAEALSRAFPPPGPWVTGIKGAVGHTSGAAFLHNLDVALRCLRDGRVPPVAGLREPIAEADGLRLVRDKPLELRPAVVQVDGFGFGGVNAVSLLECAP